MKKIQMILVAFMMVMNVMAQESAEVFIINESAPFLGQELNYTAEVNGYNIEQIISRESYLHVTINAGLCTIRLTMLPFYGLNAAGKTVSLRLSKGEKGYVSLTGNPFNPLQIKILKPNQYKKIEKQMYKNKLYCIGNFAVKPQNENYNLANNKSVIREIDNSIISDVDIDIPYTSHNNTNTFVLIISNEEYSFLDNVNFALKDGNIFKEYCKKTLGVAEKQIRYSRNATYGMLADDIEWLKYALNNTDGSKAIVYYCGHGIPDEKTGDAYIIPIDGKGTNTAACYSLNALYTTLANTKASSITYFMDACFTGANKEGSMLVAARGVAREAKKEVLEGKSVVFSASSGDETAMTYPSKGHGLFTYFLLKKLQETKGNVSYAELAEYINRNVKRESLLINNKPQTPVVATSTAASSTWGTMTLK
jgi:hypothetical protein